MIYSTCPITGLQTKLQWPTHHSGIKVQHPHPILALSITELNSLPISGSPAHKASVLAAYLYQLGAEFSLVKWRTCFPSNSLPERWLGQAIPKAANLATWLALNNGKVHLAKFPKLVIREDAGADSLQFWLDECAKVVANLQEIANIQYYTRQASKKKKESWESMAEAEESRGYDAASSAGTAYRQISQLRSLSQYIKDTLLRLEKCGLINVEIAKHIGEVLAKPKDFPLSRVRQVRQFAFEYLPDTTLEDYNDKELILQALDKIILAGTSASALLAGTERVEPLVGASPFIILSGGEPRKPEGEDGEAPSSQLGQYNQQPIAVPTTEPKREDYANALQFMIALRKFHEAEATKGSKK